MKFKLLIIITLLLCYPLISQEKYLGLRVVTWEEIQGINYTILADDGELIVREVNGEAVIIKNK